MPRRLFIVNDRTPAETLRLLEAAAASRGVEYVEVAVPSFDFVGFPPPVEGDLLFRPSVSLPAARVEQWLARSGVATLYARRELAFFRPQTPPILFHHAGIPIPKTVFTAPKERGALRQAVDALGGFPIVAKVLGGSGGVGVVRLDSWPSLVSYIDYAYAVGNHPMLCEYVRVRAHRRIVVVAGRVAGGYLTRPSQDDFRSNSDAADFHAPISAEIAEIAIRATAVGETELGGADLLESEDGRVLVSEVNFPCYFADVQEGAGVDVAGMMVDRLIAKSTP